MKKKKKDFKIFQYYIMSNILTNEDQCDNIKS